MGSAAELTEPTTGTEKHHPVQVEEEEDEQIVDLERKPLRHGKGLDTPLDTSTFTTNTSSPSSSFSGDGTEGTPNFRSNGHGDLAVLEQDTEIGFGEEHNKENNCIVFFDQEQGLWKCRHCDWTYKEGSLLCFESKGSESTGAEPDALESQAADHLGSEKRSREIEEVQGDASKDEDTVGQPAGDVIEEELDIEDAKDYDVENVLDKQETHDLFCPNCKSCITKRVILQKRKRKIRHELEDPKRLRGPILNDPIIFSEDNLPPPDGGQNSPPKSFIFKCLSCFTLFSLTEVASQQIPRDEGIVGLKTQPNPQEKAKGDSNWFSSIFGFNQKGSAAQQGGALPSAPEANPPPDNLTGSAVNKPSEASTPLQGDTATLIGDGSEISDSQVIKPVDTPSFQVANTYDASKGVNNGASVEDGSKFLTPLVEEQTQQKIDNDDYSPAGGNQTSDKVHLSPIHPAPGMSILNTVTNGPGGITVETTIHEGSAPHLFEGIDSSDTRKPDFGQTTVTGVMDTGATGVGTVQANPEVDPSSGNLLEEGSLREPLMRQGFVEGRKVEILKSIVYGGLLEAITSLGVISSAAGSGASMLNILVLGLANLIGGLILIIHNLQELREEEPIRTTTTTEDNETNSREEEEGRYKRLLGRRENFTLHATVAILSFIIVGILPPVVYYFSFSEKHNKDYKVVSVFGASLFCIVWLAMAKAHVKYPRGSYLKSILYYATIAVSVSGISYVVGNFLDQLLEKYGWSDGSEPHVGQMMLSSLMGRKAGSGYSSSY